MNAIYSWPQVADDVISGEDVDTFQYYACANLWIVFSSFRENTRKSKSAIDVMRRRRLVHLSHIFGVKEQKCLLGYTTKQEAHYQVGLGETHAA